MQTVPDVVADPGRLDAVRRFLILHGGPNPVLDRLTGLAAQLLEAPVALLTLVDRDRQYVLSAYGVSTAVAPTGLEYSICKHAVTSRRPLLVGDAQQLDLLRGHAAVIEYGVTAYAGMPLVTREGHAVGTLCVIDMVGRDWTGDQLVALSHLADIAMEAMLALVDGRGDEEWQAVASRFWQS